MNQKIQVIYCSPNRCDDCIHQKDSECSILTTGIKQLSESIILVEKQRGLIHFANRDDFVIDKPPWYSDNWESVFVGPTNRLLEDLNNLIEIYVVGPYLVFFFRNNEEYYTRYEYVPLVRTSLELSLLNKLIKESGQLINSIRNARTRMNVKQLEIMNIISDYIQNQIPEINDVTRGYLSQIVAHQSNIFGPLCPILLDEMTEEVYYDGPSTNVYLDHQQMGRCITSFTYSELEIPRIITFIRYESNLHLDRSNPSLKMDLNLFETNLRLSVSIPPLSIDGLHFEIRRARKKPFTILDLIENETMTYTAAALLLLSVACRFNITITGGPGTGKTTILNALDMTTPRWWRKVYIEDAVESRLLPNQHQVRLQVDPIDELKMRFSKSEEIIKCLHRSPDYIILGEIQTEEHSKALFQAMAAGLHSIQTCHSDSAAGLISRWIMNHSIEYTSLGLMDIIVTLERLKPGESKRCIKEIVEIRRGVQDGVLSFLGTNTVYDAKTDTMNRWSDDGAFISHAKNHRIDNPEEVIASLIEFLQNNNDIEKLAEELWNYGHPMKYITSQINH